MELAKKNTNKEKFQFYQVWVIKKNTNCKNVSSFNIKELGLVIMSFHSGCISVITVLVKNEIYTSACT